MSKTFTYILIVIGVYLLIVFPSSVGKKSEPEAETKEKSNEVKSSTTTIRAGYTV